MGCCDHHTVLLKPRATLDRASQIRCLNVRGLDDPSAHGLRTTSCRYLNAGVWPHRRGQKRIATYHIPPMTPPMHLVLSCRQQLRIRRCKPCLEGLSIAQSRIHSSPSIRRRIFSLFPAAADCDERLKSYEVTWKILANQAHRRWSSFCVESDRPGFGTRRYDTFRKEMP
jgi:hypothetical protein